MRKLNLIIVFFALGATIAAGIFYWPPFVQLATLFSDSSGRYPVLPVYGLTFLIYISPAILILVINILLSNRQRKENKELLDNENWVGIVVKREKSLYGALFPMDVYVNGEKKGSVAIGKSCPIALLPGKYAVKVIAMSRFSPEIEVQVSNSQIPLVCGFELAGSMQNAYVREA